MNPRCFLSIWACMLPITHTIEETQRAQPPRSRSLGRQGHYRLAEKGNQ